MWATTNKYTTTLESAEEGEREEGEENGGQENDTWINVSAYWENRIDCIPSIYIYSNGC